MAAMVCVCHTAVLTASSLPCRYLVRSFRLILPFFPTGTMEKVDKEGQVVTAKVSDTGVKGAVFYHYIIPSESSNHAVPDTPINPRTSPDHHI